jgi:hypothetical protein
MPRSRSSPQRTLRISTFSVNGYLVTDTMDPGVAGFTEVVYARDDRTNLAPRVAVRCNVGEHIVEAAASVGQFEHPDDVRGIGATAVRRQRSPGSSATS